MVHRLLQRIGRRGPFLASVLLHGFVVGVLVYRARPIFVQPSSIAWGKGGTSTQIVYVSGQGEEAPPLRPQLPPKKKPRKVEAKTPPPLPVEAQAARAGSALGSLTEGPASGAEARPALPIFFPDPVVARSELPPELNGDVIVEITIDERGYITETKVLQALGFGLEEKVLAALRSWRFHPATLDGVAIASRQDVHFHFPS
ncbi:MAG: TonB family protein [Acidobacteria bacterium]|nr:TonB family protein [Acidobacteriota bacterium]